MNMYLILTYLFEEQYSYNIVYYGLIEPQGRMNKNTRYLQTGFHYNYQKREAQQLLFHSL